MKFEKQNKVIINPDKWITKDTTAAGTKLSEICDVCVKIYNKGNENKETCCIYFYNGCEARITKNGYVICQVVGSRLYFAEGKQINGYSVCQGKREIGKKISITNKKLLISKEEGCYELEYDYDNKLWYIDYLAKLQ